MKYVFSIVFSLTLIIKAFAWGQTGHRVVGAIAKNHLTDKAKKQVEKLLGKESLAMAGTWMDEVRSDDAYDYTHDWHWVTIPYGKTYAESDKNPDGDLIEAIERMKLTLKSDTASNERKTVALRFLVHLVGDLHQPLHVGNGTDKGGNDVKVKFFWESSNLHRVWDSGIIDSKDLSYSELTIELDKVDVADVRRWQKGTTVDWAVDAQSYHPQVYEFKDADKLGYEYSYYNWPLVQQQLLKGGIRLAAVINEVFG